MLQNWFSSSQIS
jgi:hypothetical protein